MRLTSRVIATGFLVMWPLVARAQLPYTNEVFLAQSSRSDCGCAVGFVKNKKTDPGELLRVRLRLRPTSAGPFKRVISVSGEEGSSRNVSLNVIANVKPRFELQPPVLKIDEKSTEAVELTISSNFGEDFRNPRVTVPDGQLFRLQEVSSERKTISLALEPDQSKIHDLAFNGRLSEIEVHLLNDGEDVGPLMVPAYLARRPTITPSTFSLANGPEYRFFMAGEFERSPEELRSAKLIIQFEGLEAEKEGHDFIPCLCW